MDDCMIKVTTETLIKVSDNATTKIDVAREKFMEISDIIARMNLHWESAGYVEAAKYYNIRKDDFERYFMSMKIHIDNLKVIAGVYQESDAFNVEQSAVLPGDVIM